MRTYHRQSTVDHRFLLRYSKSELRLVSEFLGASLPFLSRGLCPHCVRVLSNRVQSLHSVNYDHCDSHPSDSWNYEAERNWWDNYEDGANGLSHPPTMDAADPSYGEVLHDWFPDMGEEDELDLEEEGAVSKQSDGASWSREQHYVVPRRKRQWSKERREYIRFMNVKRKKDFIWEERINGRFVNILEGLEVHTGVFNTAEQEAIVDLILHLQDMGKRGMLKEHTYNAPTKWMRGKGRETIQFGCCYNYAMDKDGNPPGILQHQAVDRIPPLFKDIIRRLVKWHVLPPSCVPDSCIVNIYEEGDCIPPHIDNHDFVRPFCTISLLSECNIVFGTKLKIIGAGDFVGSYKIPLPVGSVLVLSGNGADVAKHCVPSVPTKRISITFRRMDVTKRPRGYIPERDLQGIRPLRCSDETWSGSAPYHPKRQTAGEDLGSETKRPRYSTKNQEGHPRGFYSRV